MLIADTPPEFQFSSDDDVLEGDTAKICVKLAIGTLKAEVIITLDPSPSDDPGGASGKTTWTG